MFAQSKTGFVIAFILFSLNTNAQLKVINYDSYHNLVKSSPEFALVEINDSRFLKDIRYATTNNFTKEIVYDTAAVFLSLDARNALLKVAEFLEPLNIGLVIYDAYRPYRYTVKFWDIIHDDRYVADPEKGSRHNRGCAVDVGLFNLKTGQYLDMPTAYDDFSDKASVSSKERTKLQEKNVELLQKAMTSCGFQLFASEWWHFDYEGWQKYPIYDISFQDLSK
jgi:D-alanyl-D-alanine dipeptidase